LDKPLNFQDLIVSLTRYWLDYGCVLSHAWGVEVGAGTFNPATFLRTLGPEPWKVVYVEPSRRPTDGRYGENPNRFALHHQLQVIIKPAPADAQQIYLDSLRAVGIDLVAHDCRFVEDDWDSPTLGATGLGWEVWLDGQEVTQFTYFQQVGGLQLDMVSLELTYGLERIANFIQKKRSAYDLAWSDELTYGDIRHQDEVEFSHYNFELADTDMLFRLFDMYEQECLRLLKAGVVVPAYEHVLKCSHTFNLLDARRAIGVAQRASTIGRVRNLARDCARLYLQQREEMGWPLLKKPEQAAESRATAPRIAS